jgi:hypothetical protein
MHATHVQKPQPKARQVAMHVFQASTKQQVVASIAQLDGSHMKLIKLVVPSVQLDIMQKTFQSFPTPNEKDTTVALGVHVESTERQLKQ